jgi:putative membrane protein
MVLIVRVLVNALALWLASVIVDGIEFGQGSSGTDQLVLILAVAVIFGLVNALIRPIVRLFTLPLTIITLGLFTFVINALMLLLTAWLSDLLDLQFEVAGFIPALLGALVISIVSFLMNVVLPDRYES